MLRAVPLTLILALCFLGIVQATFIETVYTTTLTGAQAIPNGGFDTGNAYCILLDRDNEPSLNCEVVHNVTDIVSASIHVGVRGVNGDQIFVFDDVLGTTLSQSFDFSSVYSSDEEDLVEDFLYGRFYLSISSESSTIRGQIEQSSRYYSKLSAENTIPLASGTTSSGIATATYSFNNPTRQMSLTIVHDVERATSLELRRGAVNQVGTLDYSFPDFGNVAHGTVQLSTSEEKAIFKDLMYLNVASEPNPTGDIRGQLHTIDYIDEAAFTAELNGGNVKPDPVGTQQIGCAIVTFDCETKIMEYLVMHGIDDTSGAVIGIGNGNEFGVVLDALPTSISPIFGSIRLTNDQVQSLYTEELFFQIYFRGLPLIRGTINTDWDFFVYLTGSNELPSISTPNKGCGLVRIVGDDILQFSVTHTISDAISMDIRRGAEGTAGPTQFEISDLLTEIDGELVSSPVRGEFALDDDDLAALVEEQIYFEFPTSDNLIGEIRGQVKRIDPCDVEPISYSIDNESSDDPFISYGVSLFSKEYNIIYGSSACRAAVSYVLLFSAILVIMF